MNKWGLESSENCRSGAEKENADHVLACPCTTLQMEYLVWQLSMMTL